MSSMPTSRLARYVLAGIALAVIATGVVAGQAAQQAPQAAAGAAEPVFNSPEVAADRMLTFRVHAPQARAVRLSSPDIAPIPLTAPMTPTDAGVWQVTVGPVVAGAYRYRLDIDGVPTVDPRNPMTSESNTLVWSLVEVPGSERAHLARSSPRVASIPR